MTLSRIEEWFDNLPPFEREMPLVVVDTRAYSPKEVLSEVRKGTDLGRRMQEEVERGGATPEETLEALAVARLKKLMEERPVDIVRLVAPGEEPVTSAEELKRLIQERKGLGRKLIETEKKYIQRMMGR